MIVRPKNNWWTLLFVWRGSMMKQILPQLAIVAVLSLLAVWTEGNILAHKVPLNATPFTLVGVALALFLGFRNSSAYDRWWEGRRLWGGVMSNSRSLARQALTMTGDASYKREFIDMLIAFAYATRDQVRGETFIRSAELLPPMVAAEVDAARWKPLVILRAMSGWVAERRREGAISDIIESTMDRNIGELTIALGGCDRIANTPVPFSYSVMIHRVVYFYCALLPFGLVDAIAWMTVPVTLVLAYSFIALDSLAAELETPFKRDENGLALDAMSLNVELSLREMSGEPLEKKPLQPVNFVLY